MDLNSYLTPESLALIAKFRREPEAPDWPSHVYLHYIEQADMQLWFCLWYTDEDGNICPRWR